MKHPWMIRETYQHSLTTVGVPERRHVQLQITRPRGLLWEAWEDFSYDLAPRGADNKQLEEHERMFWWPRRCWIVKSDHILCFWHFYSSFFQGWTCEKKDYTTTGQWLTDFWGWWWIQANILEPRLLEIRLHITKLILQFHCATTMNVCMNNCKSFWTKVSSKWPEYKWSTNKVVVVDGRPCKVSPGLVSKLLR